MKVPSKKPPAIPTVQLLTSATFDSSPAATAVGVRGSSALRGRVWASNAPAPTRRIETKATSPPSDRYPIIVHSPRARATLFKKDQRESPTNWPGVAVEPSALAL